MSKIIESEVICIDSIYPTKYNPRKISETELENLSNSIKEFGFVDPIIVNLRNNHIIGGHQRFNYLYNKEIQSPKVLFLYYSSLSSLFH